MNGAFSNMPAIFSFISRFRPGPTKSNIHQATSGRLIASESAVTSRSSRYISRPSVKTSALVAPSSAWSKNAVRATGSARSTADRVNRHRGVWSARSCVFSASRFRKVCLDPWKVRWKVQSVRPGVQAGGQVQHPVAAVGDRFGDGVVDDLGARDEPPAAAARHRSLGDDRAALLARETLGQWVSEQRVGPRRFGCPIQRRPPGRVRNVGDQVPGV